MWKFNALILCVTFSVCLKAQLPIDLGSAGSFGVLAGATVTSTGATVVNGNLGVSPGSALTGFPPGIVTGGVIDAGYRGEILVLMTNLGETAIELKAGEKIAQMVPVPVLTGIVETVESLEDSARAEKGFGSSGR